MNRLLKVPKRERTKSVEELVASLMKQQEKDKKSSQLSSDDGEYVEAFATKLFIRADKQEIRGKANMKTAKMFYAASLFFEILHNFGDFPLNVEQKQRYAAWRAAEIRKALKKVRKPLEGPPARDKTSPVSDGRVVNSESSSANVEANSLEQSFSLKKLTAIRLEIDAEQDQVSFSTNQSRENFSDAPRSHDIQSGASISTSYHYEQDSSDDDSFHSCSKGVDDDVLFSNDTCSGLHQTLRAPTDVQGQVYEPSAATIAETCLHFLNRWFERTISTLSINQGQHDCSSAAELGDRGTLSSNEIDIGSDRHTRLRDDTGSILDSNITPLRNGSGSRLERTTSVPANVQGKHYEPSAAEIVKALKLSRLAVSALAFDDVPSAVSYLKQALDLLTIPPTNSII